MELPKIFNIIDPVFTMVPFKNASGGMIIVSARAGMGGPMALVTGGTLTPVTN